MHVISYVLARRCLLASGQSSGSKADFTLPTSLADSYPLLSGSRESWMGYSTYDNTVMVGFNVGARPHWSFLVHPTQPRAVD